MKAKVTQEKIICFFKDVWIMSTQKTICTKLTEEIYYFNSGNLIEEMK